ncbi:hypothetical protein BP5796_11808 [Coleophoma crateriformis]|uniref:N-acetyltransferase domain-containing protein n=1 Tax=Coleophoma crateriformis TaxID=565419 RepID=A0A3D8QED4_9HELO|nr:hypothetical protein BP5796_11808 [Coleophoma crateriformis]
MAFEDSFVIVPLPKTLEGAKSIREIETSAHVGSAIIPLLWPTAHKDGDSKQEKSQEDLEAKDKEQDAHALSSMIQPENYYFLVRDKSANMDVAFVWWQNCKGRTEAEWAEVYRNRHRPAGCNEALIDATSGVRFLKRAKYLGDRDFFMLKELYVRPEYQRRGIGSKCMEWGVKTADELGLPAYTEASEKGLGLYTRYGFEEFDRVTVNLEPWGGKEGEINSYGLLFRQAKSNGASED